MEKIKKLLTEKVVDCGCKTLDACYGGSIQVAGRVTYIISCRFKKLIGGAFEEEKDERKD